MKCNNVFSNKIKPLHVSANDGHHPKATSTSKEMLQIYYMHVVWVTLVIKIVKTDLLKLKTLLHLMEFNPNFTYIFYSGISNAI
jgi:hypothetical protein